MAALYPKLVEAVRSSELASTSSKELRMKHLRKVFLIVLVLGGFFLLYLSTQDGWLTAPLRREGNHLILVGPDLSDEIGKNQVYTYYGQGVWVALHWEGYKNGQNVWSVPDELKIERLDWEKNPDWSVDFLGKVLFWWPFGALQGTSSE